MQAEAAEGQRRQKRLTDNGVELPGAAVAATFRQHTLWQDRRPHMVKAFRFAASAVVFIIGILTLIFAGHAVHWPAFAATLVPAVVAIVLMALAVLFFLDARSVHWERIVYIPEAQVKAPAPGDDSSHLQRPRTIEGFLGAWWWARGADWKLVKRVRDLLPDQNMVFERRGDLEDQFVYMAYAVLPSGIEVCFGAFDHYGLIDLPRTVRELAAKGGRSYLLV